MNSFHIELYKGTTKIKIMKNLKITYLTIFLLTALFNPSLMGQSISGNMNSEKAASLGYGNVDIYKGDKIVASVLTDALGNFNVKLDTGYYRIELKYVGHDKLVQDIHVTGEETEDFSLVKKDGYVVPDYKKTHTMKLGEESISSGPERKVSFEYSPSRDASIARGRAFESTGDLKSSSSGYIRRLTAGEINDFAKWKVWNDIAVKSLSEFKDKWDLFLSERYTVQVKNEDGFPIQGALVQLVGENGNVSFEALTDNTGKAELWGKMGLNDEWGDKAEAFIHYKDNTYSIQRLTPFKKGVNTRIINEACGASNKVDIAFVVDATGSMGDEIDYLKAELNDVIYHSKNNLPELTFNFANIFYRDHGDSYLTRRQDFTDVLSSSINFINDQQAGGGGDYEEAVEVALNEAIDSLAWSSDARTRILFLVLDAPPHNTLKIREELKIIIRKAASKGIRIVPMVASGMRNDGEFLMRSLALGTNGTSVFLSDDSGIGSGHVKPSTDEFKVETLNDILIRIIETYTFMADCNEIEPFNDTLISNIEDSIATIEWSVWPNPTHGELQIKANKDLDELFIMDLTGKIIHRFADIQKDRIIKADLSNYGKGIYLISFVYEELVYTKKVVLN